MKNNIPQLSFSPEELAKHEEKLAQDADYTTLQNQDEFLNFCTQNIPTLHSIYEYIAKNYPTNYDVAITFINQKLANFISGAGYTMDSGLFFCLNAALGEVRTLQSLYFICSLFNSKLQNELGITPPLSEFALMGRFVEARSFHNYSTTKIHAFLDSIQTNDKEKDRQVLYLLFIALQLFPFGFFQKDEDRIKMVTVIKEALHMFEPNQIFNPHTAYKV